MKNRILIDTSGWICFFARRGTLIAVLAMDYQCTLLHKDSDFDHIARNSSLSCYPSDGM
jgi:hypothetical protein